ncbi:MAG: polysaccharide deacetylase family protein [Anaerolineales bacterium]|nr:polysaccharide deacetylase family protein [Anaerolineales bacterium]
MQNLSDLVYKYIMANISRRDFLKLGGAALLGLAGTRFIPKQAEGDYFNAPLLWHGSRSYKNIAVTYDDCNSLTRLQRVETLLDEFPKFKVTFFPIGLKLPDLDARDKGIWKRLVNKGHEIGYHSYEHVNLGVMSLAGALEDFDRWRDALVNALGMDYRVRFVRPPYDIISPTLDLLCQERGLVAALFSVGGGGAPDVVLRAIQKAKGGDIVQMHIRTEDYESSKLAFPWLKENYWDLVTMSALYDNYLREKINSNGCDVGNGLTRTCVE